MAEEGRCLWKGPCERRFQWRAEADHEMYLQVTAALKRYHEAKVRCAPDLEVERLRLISESQLRILSGIK